MSQETYKDIIRQQIRIIELERRVFELETRIKIADDNEPCAAPVPISEATLREHKEALFNANKEIEGLREELGKATHHAGHLEVRIRVLKEERNDQSQEIVELKSKIGEALDKLVNQGIIIAEYREKVEKLSRQNDIFQSNAVGATQQINGLSDQLGRVMKERDSFKLESDNQTAAWNEIKTFIPGVNGISLVGMVRRHVEELTAERNALKVEYELRRDWIAKMLKILDCENVDGQDCRDAHLVAKDMMCDLQYLKANNRYQKGYGDGAGAVIKQVRDLAAKLKV